MEHVVSAEQMEALKALSEMNLKVSEAKRNLIELEETETEYLVKREKKALLTINRAYEDSKQLIDETKNNYQKIREVLGLISESTTFISEMQGKFKSLISDFEAQCVEWDKKYQEEIRELSEVRQQVKVDRIKLESERKVIERERKALENEKKVIESRQTQIKSALELIKKSNGGKN